MNYVLYHGNCNDGFAAALAAWMAFEKKGEGGVYLPVLYGQPPPSMDAGNDVYILDFSYPAKTLLEIGLRQNKVVVIDHHATAQKDLCLDAFCEAASVHKDAMQQNGELSRGQTLEGFDRCRNVYVKFDMEKSGAVLAWEFFHPNDITPLLFLYVQDRDLWNFVLPSSRSFSAFLQTVPMEFTRWALLARGLEDPDASTLIFHQGDACLALKEKMVESMAQNARWMLFNLGQCPPTIIPQVSAETFRGGWLAPVANATCFFSEVGEKLLELYPDAKFSAYYLDRGDGKRQWGMRSRPDFDCSAVAKAFGGGGHKQASGFTTKMPE